jgi:hypothetical protein
VLHVGNQGARTRVFPWRDAARRRAGLTSHHAKPAKFRKEIIVNSSSTQPPTPEGSRRPTDRPRINTAWKALLWTAVIALAVAPYPWWW